MLTFLVLVPFVYLIAGCLYGAAAVARRAYLSAQFSKLSQEEQDGWRDTAANRRFSGGQVTSLVVSALFFLSVVTALLGYIGRVSVGDLAGWALVGLMLLPPFIVGFQARAVWKRDRAFLEEAGLRGNVGWMRAYYAVLIPTWLSGVIGSYIVSFLAFTNILFLY